MTVSRRTTALTARQRAVVELLSTGLSCPQIARRLGIALNTVRQHVRNVAGRLQGDDGLPAIRRIRKHAAELLRERAA